MLRAHRGERVLLVRIETSPEDLRGMIAAEGILTARGGVSSHAALVARQMGKVCVCGASDLRIDYANKKITASGHVLKEGDFISIDGTAGAVFPGEVTTAPSEIVQVLVSKTLQPEKSTRYADYAALMRWADKCRNSTFEPMRIRPNRSKMPSVSERRALASAAPSICSSKEIGSTQCAR